MNSVASIVQELDAVARFMDEYDASDPDLVATKGAIVESIVGRIGLLTNVTLPDGTSINTKVNDLLRDDVITREQHQMLRTAVTQRIFTAQTQSASHRFDPQTCLHLDALMTESAWAIIESPESTIAACIAAVQQAAAAIGITNPSEATLKVATAIVVATKGLQDHPKEQLYEIFTQLKRLFAANRRRTGLPHITQYPPSPQELPRALYDVVYGSEEPAAPRDVNILALSRIVPARTTNANLRGLATLGVPHATVRPADMQQQLQGMLVSALQGMLTGSARPLGPRAACDIRVLRPPRSIGGFGALAAPPADPEHGRAPPAHDLPSLHEFSDGCAPEPARPMLADAIGAVAERPPVPPPCTVSYGHGFDRKLTSRALVGPDDASRVDAAEMARMQAIAEKAGIDKQTADKAAAKRKGAGPPMKAKKSKASASSGKEIKREVALAHTEDSNVDDSASGSSDEPEPKRKPSASHKGILKRPAASNHHSVKPSMCTEWSRNHVLCRTGIKGHPSVTFPFTRNSKSSHAAAIAKGKAFIKAEKKRRGL